jgi:hypothetical protein
MAFEELQNIGTRECQKWSQKIFCHHMGIDQYLKTRYIRVARSSGYREANSELREIDQKLMYVGSTTAAMDEEAINNLASIRSLQCKGIYKECGVKGDIAAIGEKLDAFCKVQRVEFPLEIKKKDAESDIMEKILCAAERVSDERWWRRQLRKICGRQTENVLRESGFVRSEKSPYVSRWALARWKAAQSRNKKILSGLEAVTHSEEGEEITVDLLECVESSVSNPENRRNELMTRMSGYEEIAKGLGLIGLFFTLTCPSKYHAQTRRGGINPNYSGATPRDALENLNKTWSLIRAEWARKGIKTFGFRVAEPHHDGTPHYHFLLFINPDEREIACDIFGRYALREDAQEAGALKNRWDVCVIDPAKGSASGYIAKYVSKNIDGYAVGVDEEGQCLADDGAMRARAWASLWGIRQFQPIGSVSVTVWRELRRKREIFDELTPEEVEPIRAAADSGDWQLFVELMGGAFVKRDEQTLRPAYVESETVSSHYGEGVKRLIGVWLKPVAHAIGRCMVATRDKVWTIRERDVSRNLLEVAQPPPSDLCQ